MLFASISEGQQLFISRSFTLILRFFACQNIKVSIHWKQSIQHTTAQEYQVFIEASVRGYHAHFKDATVFIGGVLTCESEPDNAFDKYAVAIKNEAGHMVGHVPKELSKIFNKFLKDYGEIEAECIGNRYNAGQGKGLELPVDFRLLGNKEYLRRLVRKIKEKLELSISDISLAES